MTMKKALAPDGITKELVKATLEAVPERVVSVMNTLLKQGEFPAPWKEAKLLLIEEIGKAGEDKKYRPICLLNTFGK